MSIRVAIADDSSIFREVLRDALEEDGDLQVVAEAANGAEAIQVVERTKPDFLVVDVLMPGVDGLKAIEEIMARQPLPILVLTSIPTSREAGVVFEATRRGALEVREKKEIALGSDGGARIRELIRQLSHVKVVRHVRGPALQRDEPPPLSSRPEPQPTETARKSPEVIGIGASAGGPPAVAAVLEQLPADFPACVAIVQHIAHGFTDSLVQFLQRTCRLPVRAVTGVTEARPGTVLVAPDHRHLVATSSRRFDLDARPPEKGHRPSVDFLFSSLASSFADRAVGVILTGIGDDGAKGLLELRLAGAMTIAQDEETAVVFGMPKAAAERGAAVKVLALHRIAPTLLALTGRSPTPAWGKR